MAKKKGGPKRIKLTEAQVRDIYAIILAALALFSTLSLLGYGGVLGEYLAQALRLAVGVGSYLVPVLLVIWALLLFTERWRKVYLSRGAGIAAVLISFISIVHLSSITVGNPATAFNPGTVITCGGYIGAVVSYAFIRLAGKAGAYIILSAALLVGIVVMAGISLGDYLTEAIAQGRRGLARTKRRTRSAQLPKTDMGNQAMDESKQKEPPAEDRLAETIRIEETKVLAGQEEVPVERVKDKQYIFPPLDLLKMSTPKSDKVWKKSANEQIKVIEETLRDFGVDAVVAKVVKGPTVTRFEIQMGSGVKVNRVVALANDLALALAAPDIRILAPIPGKSLVGIEVPSEDKEIVMLGDVLAAAQSKPSTGPLMVGIGKDIGGSPVTVNLAQMPHLLISGATGSGKTTCVNAIITSLLFFAHPDQVRMILIDPKMVELSHYGNVPHLAAPVITNPKKASLVLGWSVREMERRFKVMAEAGARNIDYYNKERRGDEPLMSYLVIVIDELADLMMVAPAEVEDSICRLTQMGRAVGIMLVVATQRPSVDVITGLIKANIPSRISFEVASQMDSRVILDMAGAEKLVGRGDMLFLPAGSVKPKRIQGAFLTETEIAAVTGFIRNQREPEYSEDILLEEKKSPWTNVDYKDPLLDQAIEIVVRSGHASISMLQRRLRVGYSRAARLVDTMEERGIVGGADGSKPRNVLLSEEEFERLRGDEA